jgi:hypothetical protein
MNDNMTTLLCVMALEGESSCDLCKGGADKNVLLIVCPTTETDQGNLEVTARMRDLACMGFNPSAIARCNADDASEFVVFAIAGLSKTVQSALTNESGRLIEDALSNLADQTDRNVTR